ncbi:hypothetical protein RND71_011411 [Anisodus tanguticus]|uniref:Uncharacterized protein n=1 Tax=Anisodus tanguticus TaxID=243964 RepID=A0AAE1SB99_9SOLA|nr:hypothetical protein RND71_011411 [Anisodus tanguticus]
MSPWYNQGQICKLTISRTRQHPQKYSMFGAMIGAITSGRIANFIERKETSTVEYYNKIRPVATKVCGMMDLQKEIALSELNSTEKYKRIKNQRRESQSYLSS